MNELISRAKAINALSTITVYKGSIPFNTAVMRIEQLPSARSESFEWCTDCKEYDQEAHCCHRWSKMIRKTVEEMQIVRCEDCKYNYGLTHGGEFNPEDIVCTYFDTDGMQCYDFCSYGER